MYYLAVQITNRENLVDEYSMLICDAKIKVLYTTVIVQQLQFCIIKGVVSSVQ